MTNFLWLLYRYHLDTLFMIFWICFEWMAGIPCKSRDSYLYSVTRQVFFNKNFRKLKEMVLHHVCCITCATIAVYTGTYSGYAMVGLSMEVNSIFLHARSAQRLNFKLQIFKTRRKSEFQLTHILVHYFNTVVSEEPLHLILHRTWIY